MEPDELADVQAVIEWAESYPVNYLKIGEITLETSDGTKIGMVKTVQGYFKFVPVIENGVEYKG